MLTNRTRAARYLTRRALPLFLLTLPLSAPAAPAPGTPDSVAIQRTTPEVFVSDTPATLRLGNREIVEFRATVLGYTPEQRVEAAAGRFRDVIAACARGETRAVVEVRESELGRLFHVDGRWVFAMTPADVHALGGETFDQVAARARENLESAVTASLEQRTISSLVRSIAFSVLATVLLWGLLHLLRKFSHRLGQRVEMLARERTTKINVRSTTVLRQIRAMIRGATRLAMVVVALLLVDIWLTFVLKQFPYTYPWGDQIDDYLIRLVSGVGLAILRSIPNLLMLAVIFTIARLVDRWVRLFFNAVREGRIVPPGVDSETAVPAQRLVVLLVWIIALAIAYPFVPGSQGIAFKGLSVLLGLMLSLGSSNVVSQAASGYMIMFSKALRTNDYVRIGEYEGTIMSVGMLSTKIRTPRDEEINVPNAMVVSTTVKNYTRLNRESGAPLAATVTIGYSAPWRQVHAMLLEAAEKTSGLRKEPAPAVLQTELSDFYVEYTLVARLEVPQARVVVLSELHANIQDIFNVHGVQIMSPHYETDPASKVWVPKEKWYEPPAGDPEPKSKGT